MAELAPMFSRRNDRRTGAVLWLGASFFALLLLIFGVISSEPAARSGPTPPSNSSTPSDSSVSAAHPHLVSDEPTSAEKRMGLDIVQHGGYPELRVDGQPFFIHSAAFFYDRIPRDMWKNMLERYRTFGINTLDIYIPWNWHEPKQGEFDFDGRTNPRRDLRSLLALIIEKRFRLIARPGPEILNEWRHGGYPGWLLERPEYKMDPLDWVEGRYAPLDNLNAHDAEAAAEGWLANPTHMEETRAWLTAVGKELAPYSSHATVHPKPETRGETAIEASGPLLFVQLGDDFAIGRTNRVGPAFWRYVEELRGMLVAGGLDVPVFINPTDMRVSAAGSGQQPSIGVMGQWYMRPHDSGHTAQADTSLLTARDATEIEFFAEELETQPAFPPVLVEYQAGWYTPADDDRPPPSLPENTLLSSRLLIGNGLHGFNYFPLQDTFTPAGYSVPWANRSYRWDAALSPDGNPQPKLQGVKRNTQALQKWGELLAASHKRADFGIIYPLGSYSQDALTPQDITTVSESTMRIERVATLAMLSAELVDPEFQPVDQLLRHPLLLLPVFDPQKPEFLLSDRAQSEIVEYVKRGGTLVVFPVRPLGKIIGELWNGAPEETSSPASSPISRKWKIANGEVIESSQNFYSWVSLDDSLSENRNGEPFASATATLRQFVDAAGLRPILRFSGQPHGAEDLIASEIVTNEGTELLGDRKSGRGFLIVTNLAEHGAADATMEILSPFSSAKGSDGGYSTLTVAVPARDSLILPLGIPLCSATPRENPCDTELLEAGAEFLDASREGKTLKLDFYVPARAEIHLHLSEKPSRAQLDETDTHPDSSWFPDTHEFQLTLPRGAAPDFRRTLKLDLPFVPNFEQVKKNQPGKAPPEDIQCYVANAVRFPTSGDAFLRTFPALIVPDPDQKMNVLLMAENTNESATGNIDLSFEKPLHGTKNLVVPARGTASELIEFRSSDMQSLGSASSADHLFHTAIEVRTGGDRRVLPLVFLLHTSDVQEHYRFDFDRDGADEWVLENDRLRLIVSPESGGRAVALMDKLSGVSLATSVGLFRDNFSFTPNPPGVSEARKRGKYGLSNRPYTAEWGGEADHPELRLHYDAAEVFPAGATIEKSLQLDGSDGVQVTYRVGLHPQTGSEASTAGEQQSFVAVDSLPAQANNGASTRFCWQEKPPATPPSNSEQVPAPANGQKCQDFVPDGTLLSIPEGTNKIQVFSPGRPRMELGWDCVESCGKMAIEPKHFSALFRLQFPALAPGAEGKYVLHIHILSGP